MRTIPVTALKITLPFRAGELPAIDAADPSFTIELGSLKIQARISPKSARKLASHPGSAVLQGRLVAAQAGLVLEQAGFSWIDAKPAGEGS
ncbi:MAG: hypothetical protein ABSH35_33115 [Isosphaeraceae bacterium]|jgi:hypothetical protein